MNEIDPTIEAHKKFGPDLYNLAWELIEKPDRTTEETDLMLQATHGSAFHWAKMEGHIDEKRWKDSFAISHNQIAFAYIQVGNAERALYHANRSLEYFNKYGEGGFPIAYCYECLARVYDLAGDVNKRNEAIKTAIEKGNMIPEEQFRTSFFEELAKVKGYEEVRGNK